MTWPAEAPGGDLASLRRLTIITSHSWRHAATYAVTLWDGLTNVQVTLQETEVALRFATRPLQCSLPGQPMHAMAFQQLSPGSPIPASQCFRYAAALPATTTLTP